MDCDNWKQLASDWKELYLEQKALAYEYKRLLEDQMYHCDFCHKEHIPNDTTLAAFKESDEIISNKVVKD